MMYIHAIDDVNVDLLYVVIDKMYRCRCHMGCGI